MTIDDLIAAFTDLAKSDPHARFEWTSAGEAHTIRLAGWTSPHSYQHFRALLNDAGELIPASASNPGRTPTERFIVEVFERASELIDNPPTPWKDVGSATVQDDGGAPRTVPYSSARILNAAQAAILTLRRMKPEVTKESVPVVALDPRMARLQWLLDKMIRMIDSVPPTSALGEIGSWEPEAAELIESTGLADELGMPTHCRPVFKRRQVEFDEHGFPRTTVYSYVSPDGTFASRVLEPWYVEARDLPEETGPVIWQRVVPPHLVPDAAFIRDLRSCVKEWREYTDAPRLPVNFTPNYDVERRELTYAGKVVKKFTQPAKNQEKVLSAFQEEGWPTRIDDPLPAGKLNETVRGLNENTKVQVIRFEADGESQGIRWSRVS